METNENRLHSYKLARATGFAPNPYFGVLTLAACKPELRRIARLGDWIAGWTSKSLKDCPTEVGKERLVYLARVTRKLTFPEYWEQYPRKRPDLTNPDDAAYHGDNIYEPAPGYLPDPQQPDTFLLRPCSQAKDHVKKAKDLKAAYVLVCEEFYYFDPSTPLEIPEPIQPSIPQGRTIPQTHLDAVAGFIAYVKGQAHLCKETHPISKTEQIH